MNSSAYLAWALGRPTEAEALEGVSVLAMIPAALAGMALAGGAFVSANSSFGVLAAAMLGGGVGGALPAIALVRLIGRRCGFAAVAWVPLTLLGCGTGLALGGVLDRGLSFPWSLSLAGAGAVAGVVATYRLRARAARPAPPLA